MHRTARLIAPVALMLGFVWGCGGSSTAPPAAPSSETLTQALKTVLPATVTVPSNVDTTASLLFTLHIVPAKAAGAAFETGGQLVDAGNAWIRTVSVATLDSVQLTETIAATGGRMITVYGALLGAPGSHDLPFDGSKFHVFHVAGSAAISAFIDSVKSVDDLDITAPSEGAAIPKSGGLTVTWSDGGADTAVKVAATVIAGTDSTLRAAADVVSDPAGTLQIPAGRLNLLPNGPARLAIARYRLTYSVEGTHAVGMVCETVEVRNVTLN